MAVCLTLSIPEAILLALLAFVADAIPLVGALIATVPAVLLAWTVSPTRAIIVLVLYVVYQQIENHFIVPRIYKSALQISSFGVLLSVAIGAHLLGISAPWLPSDRRGAAGDRADLAGGATDGAESR